MMDVMKRQWSVADLSQAATPATLTEKRAMKKEKKKSFDKKKQSQDKTKHSIYKTFRLKLKSLSIYKHHDVRIVEKPSI